MLKELLVKKNLFSQFLADSQNKRAVIIDKAVLAVIEEFGECVKFGGFVKPERIEVWQHGSMGRIENIPLYCVLKTISKSSD